MKKEERVRRLEAGLQEMVVIAYIGPLTMMTFRPGPETLSSWSQLALMKMLSLWSQRILASYRVFFLYRQQLICSKNICQQSVVEILRYPRKSKPRSWMVLTALKSSWLVIHANNSLMETKIYLKVSQRTITIYSCDDRRIYDCVKSWCESFT